MTYLRVSIVSLLLLFFFQPALFLLLYISSPNTPLILSLFAVVFVILYHKDTPTHTTAHFNLAIDLILKPIIPSHFPFFANKLAIIVIKRLSF